MKILALDLALTQIGVAKWDSDVIVSWSTLKAPSATSAKNPNMDANERSMKRIRWIVNEIITTAVNGWYDLVVMEDLALQSGTGKSSERAGLAWIIRYELYNRRVPYLLVAPMSLKKFVTGKGVGDKDRMLESIQKDWGHMVATDHEADAVGLAYVGATWLGERPHASKAEAEVVNKLLETQPRLHPDVAISSSLPPS